jgi:hypothetical protein
MRSPRFGPREPRNLTMISGNSGEISTWEHHGNVSFRRVDAGDISAIQYDFPACHSLQTADGTKKRAFSASGRSNKDNEFLLLNLQVDVLQRVKGFVMLLDLNKFQISHRGLATYYRIAVWRSQEHAQGVRFNRNGA